MSTKFLVREVGRDAEGPEAGVVDGRRQRAVRSRERVLDAIYEVFADADLDVTVERIAARAGVSLSTIRRHFGDIPRMSQAMRERILSRILPILTAPAPTGSREERLRTIVARRCEVFEILMPGMRVAVSGERGNAARGRADRKQLESALLVQLAAAFPDELAGDPGAALEQMLSSTLSLAAWEHLRTVRELPPQRCAGLMEQAALALLKEATRG